MEESSIYDDDKIGGSMIDKESTDVMVLMGSDRSRCGNLPLSERKLKKAAKNSGLWVQNVKKAINVFEKEGSHSIGVRNDSCENKKSDIISNQEHIFGVGDLVWIRTRTQLWWPGIVSDPTNAVKDQTNPERSCPLLVKYFGNRNLMWCSSADLKHFVKDFDQLSGQNDSSNFKGAMEKSLFIIGQRIKSRMSCNCILKNSTQDLEESSAALYNTGQRDDFAVSRFEPASFVASVKSLAQAASVSSKLKLTVTKNQLLSFYSSVGHLQLPLQLLKQSCDYSLKTPDVEESSTASDSTDQLEDFASSRFEPASFLASVKCLARAASVSSKLELTVITNHLSAFYSSVGHLQLPLRLLKQSGDYVTNTPNRSTSTSEVVEQTRQKRSRTDETGLVSDDIGSSSRKRKKNKRLSFPYMDVNETEVSPSSGLKETEDSSDLSILPSKPRSIDENNSTTLVQDHHELSQADEVDLRLVSDESMKCAERQSSPRAHLRKDETISTKQAETEEINIATGEESLGDVDMNEKFTEDVNCTLEKKMVCSEENTNSVEHVETAQKSVDSLGVSPNSSGVGTFEQSCSGMPKTSETSLDEIVEPPPGFEQIYTSSKFQKSVDSLGVSPSSSGVSTFEQSCSGMPKTSETSLDEIFEPPPGFEQIYTSSKLPDLNENCLSFSNDHVPSSGGSFTSPDKPFQGKSNEELVSVNEEGVDPTKANHTSSLSSKNVQEILHSNEKLNDSHDLNDTTCARAEKEKVPDVINIGIASLEMRDLPSTMKPHHKKMKLADGFSHITGSDKIPDLNQKAVETSSPSTPLSEKFRASTESNPQKKRKGRNKSDSVESGSDVKANKRLNTKDDPGAILVLEFSPGFALPSKENLISIFSRYGLIDESEIKFPNDLSAQVCYMRISDAKFAHRSLEKSNPFGASLSKFKIYRKSSVSRNGEGENNSSETTQSLIPIDAHESIVRAGKKKNPQKNNLLLKAVSKGHQKSVPVDTHNDSNKVPKTPDVAFMRKNVEMMKSTLEKAGDRLLPEVRIRLENEIKGFLDKISSMAGSPTPSS